MNIKFGPQAKHCLQRSERKIFKEDGRNGTKNKWKVESLKGNATGAEGTVQRPLPPDVNYWQTPIRETEVKKNAKYKI